MVVAVAWWGIALLESPAQQVFPGRDYAGIYQRATNGFVEADFFKPAEVETNRLAFALAPLMLEETGEREEKAESRKQKTESGKPETGGARRVVYWEADSVQIHGKRHARFSYLWCYPADASELEGRPAGRGEAGSPPHAASGTGAPRALSAGGQKQTPPSRGGGVDVPLRLQGIRMTLNSAGQPVVWEVLDDSSGAELIFVSQGLESAAAAEFGKALPGRRYSSERSLAEAPKVVVARIIDDGPVPMGPIIYLTAGTHDVSTLICRCMPSQAKRLRATRMYELAPLDSVSGRAAMAGAKAQWPGHAAFWPGAPAEGDGPDGRLRLPGTF